ncbi:hypothetical protein ACFYUJ_21025 [Streptomyces sp. NPDC004520]
MTGRRHDPKTCRLRAPLRHPSHFRARRDLAVLIPAQARRLSR